MGILYYVVEINFFYWKILLLGSVFASLFIIYIFGTDLPTRSYYLQFPSADLFFFKKSSGHPLEFSVAGECRLDSGGLKQKGNLGAHLAVKPQLSATEMAHMSLDTWFLSVSGTARPCLLHSQL